MSNLTARISRLRTLMEKLQLPSLLVSEPSNVTYLSGFGGSDAMLLLTDGEQFILTDSRYQTQVKEECPGWKLVLIRRSLVSGVVATVQKLNLSGLAFEANYLSYRQFQLLREELPDTGLIPAAGLVEQLRLVKDSDEIELIRQAGTITGASLRSALGEMAQGQTEQEIAGLIEYRMRQMGGGAPAFETIVAAGERGALPHAVPSERRLKRGDLVVCDLGATYRGYAADLTRTVAIGVCGDQQRKIYELVLEAQQRAIGLIKAGVTAGEADAAARDYLTSAGYGDQFSHSLGHGVGLQIHEGPRLARGEELVLSAGMIVTVEPGLYLPGQGGVRIEDTVLVTEEGCEILTPVSKELVII